MEAFKDQNFFLEYIIILKGEGEKEKREKGKLTVTIPLLERSSAANEHLWNYLIKRSPSNHNNQLVDACNNRRMGAYSPGNN